MAAIAVLAVVFAATAVVLVSDDVSADTTKTEKIGEYEVVFENSMDATIVGDKITFSGYATAATVSGDASSYSGLFNQGDRLNKDVLDSYSAIYVKALNNCKIKQTNNALAEYDGQTAIVHDAATGAWTKTSEIAGDYTSGYAFLIPKDNSDVTIEILDSDNKVLKKLTFDFDQVSTKIVLGSKAIKSDMGATPAWEYKTDKTLTFTNYSGKEIFRTTENLKIVLNGTNTISAYGAVNNYEGSAIYAGKALAISANDSADASLNVTQNTAGAYGIVSYSETMTIGSATENVKKVTLTVDGKPNRAIYAVGGLEVNNAKIVAQSTEKTIRSNGAMAIGVKADVTANLLSLSGNSQGDDDYMGIKGASLTVGAGSIVTTQGLCLTGDEPFGDTTSSAIAGKVIVSGDYAQNPKTDVKPVIAGLYLKAAVTGVEAIRVAPAADATGIFLINDAQAYNIDVKNSSAAGAPVTEKTVTSSTEAETQLGNKDIAKVTLITGAAGGVNLVVPASKTLVVNATGAVSGTITTGDAANGQSIVLDDVIGTFTITKGSVILDQADITSGSFKMQNGSAKVDLVIASDADLGTFSFIAENETSAGKEAKVTVPAGVTVDSTSLNLGKAVTMYVAGTVKGTINGEGKIVLLGGGDVSGAHVNCTITRDSDDSTMETIGVRGTIKTPEIGPDQIVKIDGQAEVAPGTTLVIKGKLEVPEGSKLIIRAGATVVLKNLAVAQIDGDLEIEAAEGTYANGKLLAEMGFVKMNASQSIDGTIEISKTDGVKSSLEIAKDVALTMEDTSSLITADGVSLTVKASGTLEILGAFDGVAIANSGTVIINSDYAATAASSVKLKADGAVLDVQKYTVKAENSAVAKIEVTDDGNTLKTYKENGVTKYVKLSGSTKVTIEASNLTDADYTVSVSGIAIVEVISSYEVDGADAPASGIYNKRQYTQTLDVAGSFDATYAYVGTGTIGEKSPKAVVSFVSSGENRGIAVTGTIALSENAVLNNAATLKVSGKITSPESNAGKGFNGSAGTVTLSENGEVAIVKDKFSSEEFVNATRYVTEAQDSTGKKTKTYHYVTIDSALTLVNAEGNTVKDITALGTQAVSADNKLPAGVTLDVSGAEFAVGYVDGGEAVTLTVAKGATVKGTPESFEIKGTLFAENKTDVKNSSSIVSDVYTEQTENGVAVKNGWAKWTNLVSALNGAVSGETITVSNTDVIDIASNMTVKEGVTLILPDGTEGIRLLDGVTLTIVGTLKVSDGANIYAQSGFDLTANKVTGSTTEKHSSTVVVTGMLMTEVEVQYKHGVTATAEGAGVPLISAAATGQVGAPVAGAYYQTDKYYVITTLENAVADSKNIISSEIKIHGKVSAGDVAVKGTDSLKNIKVCADGAVSGATYSSSSYVIDTLKPITTELTVGSLTLDGVSLIVEPTVASPAYVTGTVVIGDSSVAFKHATGSADAIVSVDSDGKYILGVTALNAKGDSLTVSSGTVYTGGNVTIDNANTTGAIKVATGAILIAKETAIYKKLIVDGTLSVPENKQMTATTLEVNGVVSVAAPTSTSAAGKLFVGALYIGINEKDMTGAAAAFNGPVDVQDNGKVFVSSSAAVDEAFIASLEGIKATNVHVNGSVWFTAYGKGTATFDLKTVPVQNVKLTGWAKTEGGELLTVPVVGSDDTSSATVRENFGFDSEDYFEDLYALIDTQVYKIVIKADEGIADVYINGQAMSYGLVGSSDFDGVYYAYFATVAAGDYKVTYTLKNGWSGEAKLTGDNVSGMSFKVSGDYSKESVYQLTGVEKSGYVEPVTPSEDKSDDGLTVTDYLLIVLVVLIVILAVIVAMRLMRS